MKSIPSVQNVLRIIKHDRRFIWSHFFQSGKTVKSVDVKREPFKQGSAAFQKCERTCSYTVDRAATSDDPNVQIRMLRKPTS